ncbi:host cell division inhibitor Icd-like protein [Escherichia coli]|nr:host cell division inhibitor Icd-like protein [Escherichia coli]EJS5583641.1 host cell division inhibitor Icd-like protein [Escherichia coli]EKQ3784450.1 host cell division inhibitor Icd-like protein [Escherichia coli]EKQ3814525.1 host cell division inhibitor Icd-like protein [Escherichia coli]EKQ3864216.1 host cell division inhibitor Icd-like protein [Escherichia coli]
MNTGYTPVQGRGFVRPENQNLQNFAEIIPVISGLIGGSETNIVNARALQMLDEKGVNLTYPPDGNQNMSIISEPGFYKLIKTKSAPLPERPCEQLTYCAKNESVQWDYINRVAKRHNCRITGKTKATRYGGPSTQATRYPQRMSIANNATFAAGGQCDQCAGLLVGYSCSLTLPCRDVFQVCDPIFVRLYSFKNFSRANAHGANLSCSCSLTAFLRCFFLDEDNFFNDLSVIVDTCNPVRHSSPHHGAGDGYSCSLAFLRWRRLISPSNAAVTNCPVLSPSSLTLSMASTIWSGTRASILFDFAFTDFVAISDFRLVWCPTMIARKKFNAMLDVSHTDKITCVRHLIYISHKMTKPRTVGAVTGLLTTNDRKRIEVAMLNHTTHPQGRDSHNLNKYIWRFIALSTAQPRVITIEATSEQEARQQSPAGCVMVFAARIRQGETYAQ